MSLSTMQWVPVKECLPKEGEDALILYKESGSKTFGTIEIAEYKGTHWRVSGGKVPLTSVSHYAIITMP